MRILISIWFSLLFQMQLMRRLTSLIKDTAEGKRMQCVTNLQSVLVRTDSVQLLIMVPCYKQSVRRIKCSLHL